MVRFGFVSIGLLGGAFLGLDVFDSNERGTAATAVTYSETIAPIINRSCVKCHRPDGGAPFSLVGYENVKKWSAMITTVTKSGYMPPWKAVEGYGSFHDENRITKEEMSALETWANENMPRGEALHEPPVPPAVAGWPLGKPDLVLQMEKPMSIAAEGKDIYRTFVIKHSFKKPTWIKAVQVRPTNMAITHHALVFLDSMGQALHREKSHNDGLPGFPDQGGAPGFIPTGFIGTWAPGSTLRKAPSGSAFLVTPKDRIVLQVHYHRSGKPETDQTQLGIYYAEEPIKKELMIEWIMNADLRIPANDDHVVVSYEKEIRDDVTVHSVLPHMHNLGKEMKAEARLPDGSIKPLIWVKNWDFRWQITYYMKSPVKLPRDSVVHIEAIYDNSDKNPLNPNHPPKKVKNGNKTTDEMFMMLLGYTLDEQKLKG